MDTFTLFWQALLAVHVLGPAVPKLCYLTCILGVLCLAWMVSPLTVLCCAVLCFVLLCPQMSERAARTQIVELQERLDAQDATVLKLQKQLQARSDGLATQRAVNQQLMMKKEEVEWQLLAAIAQVG